MNKLIKRISCVMLAVLTVLSCVALPGYAANDGLPEADVSVLGPRILKAGEHVDSLTPGEDLPLDTVVLFSATQTGDEARENPYASWYADFYITVSGLASSPVSGDNCYLAGQFDLFGERWRVIPLDGADIYSGESSPIVQMGTGFILTYVDVCDFIKDFYTGIYVDRDLLAANPDFKLVLELRLTNPDDPTDFRTVGDVYPFYGADLTAVAKIGDVKYASLEAAIAAAQPGDTVELTRDIVPEGALTVPAGKEFTLDLAGYSISQSVKQTKAYSMLTNYGDLTIMDSVGGGRLSYTDTGVGGEYVSNTITNAGSLTVNSGIIENLSSDVVGDNGYPYAIDCNSTTADVSLTVNGGTITGTAYCALRQFCNSTTRTNTAVINGGEFTGGIDFQNPNKKANNGSLTINGGTFNDNSVNRALYIFAPAAGSDCSNMSVSVTGGVFFEPVKLGIGMDTATGFEQRVISGGTYSEEPKADYIAETFAAVKNQDGTFGIKSLIVASIGEQKFSSLQAAVDAAAEGDTVLVLEDIVLDTAVVVGRDKNITIDLGGCTVSRSVTQTINANDCLLRNLGTLTLTGEGTLTYSYTGDKVTRSASTISNEQGTLTVDGDVNIINTTSNGTYGYAIDSLTNGKIGPAAVTIENGCIESEYVGIRQFVNGSDCDNTLTINGGSVSGKHRAVNAQDAQYAGQTDASAVKDALVLTINGGDFAVSTEDGYALCVIGMSNNLSVTGGSFSGWVFDYGTYYGQTPGFISGGVFDREPTPEDIAEGYEAIRREDEKWIVVPETVAPATPVLTAYTYGYTSIGLKWEAVEGAEGYEIYRCDKAGQPYNYILSAEADATSARDTDLSTGAVYFYKIRAYVTNPLGEKVYSDYSAYSTDTVARPLPATPVLTAQRTSTTTAKLSWASIYGADGYSIYRSTEENGEYKYVAGISAGDITEWEDTGLASTKTYYYQLRAYRRMGSDLMFGGYSNIAVANAAPGVTTVTARSVGYTSAKIEWQPVEGADGYAVYRCDIGGGAYSWVADVEADVTSYTNTGLSTGTTYYYKVRAFANSADGKLYGNYSLCATARPVPATPVVSAVYAEETGVTLSWAKIYGATGYSIYRASEKDGEYTFLANLTDGEISAYTDAAGDSTCFYKVRACRQMGTDRMFGNYSEAVCAG